MITLLKWQENLKGLTHLVFIDKWLNGVKSFDLAKLQKKQWSKGENYKGEIIGYYKRDYLVRGRTKKRNNHYNLEWSGDLFNSVYFEAKNKDKDLIFKIDTNKENKEKLFNVVAINNFFKSSTMFGLNEENNSLLVEKLEDEYVKLVKKYLT
jgi:hypothetical protein